ncbi:MULTISPECIES: DUF4244 domain-containing protein [Gordonia]|uniref:DUF4244 domain-containing protein n=2 Tax=Gordonia TaxID=2053 RepID=L7LNK2_9ACTN|nr:MULTISPECIES: DUF4244 domain-containing protein [Gordonia]AUH67792.1 DUF4244 domain-containing protein [Gordonia sp. YC-JH1]MBY4568880.1 hypothetical protein [Gordonia sihwensis]GAC62715.1 hypothetical protein GSI01S_41_00160 [Gordonia sihwensis NBRC 108236]
MTIPGTARQRWTEIRELTIRLAVEEEGMSTAEYAIGTIAAAAFGALLYTVVTGDSVLSALTGIIGKALSTSAG